MVIAIGRTIVMMARVGAIVNSIGARVLVSATLACRGDCARMAEENLGSHLQPRGVVVAVTEDHRGSRHRLHRQRQQQQCNSEMADALSHAKSIALLMATTVRRAALARLRRIRAPTPSWDCP
jgi:hypothetical protein